MFLSLQVYIVDVQAMRVKTTTATETTFPPVPSSQATREPSRIEAIIREEDCVMLNWSWNMWQKCSLESTTSTYNFAMSAAIVAAAVLHTNSNERSQDKRNCNNNEHGSAEYADSGPFDTLRAQCCGSSVPN